MNFSNKLISSLFETKAVRVCPKDKPFWYTSGTIGPYYVNTHFLYGSEKKANDLLKLIDEAKANKITCPNVVLAAVRENYNSDAIFKGLIDIMIDFIKKNVDLAKVKFISGGERRDWFFSLIIAEILDIPHITIYKDLSAVLSNGGIVTEVPDLNGVGVLHIADLITEASSYERAWIPAINAMNGKMIYSLVVVDRMQGGAEYLKSADVIPFSLVNIDKQLFDSARSQELIDEGQLGMIYAYLDNPREAMRSFLLTHQEFMQNALSSDDKTKERAALCMEKDFYGLI